MRKPSRPLVYVDVNYHEEVKQTPIEIYISVYLGVNYLEQTKQTPVNFFFMLFSVGVSSNEKTQQNPCVSLCKLPLADRADPC